MALFWLLAVFALPFVLVALAAVIGVVRAHARHRRERQRLETRPDVWSLYQRELLRRQMKRQLVRQRARGAL